MWTAENRSLYNRDKPRYPSDLTDAEWRRIDPLTPPVKSGGGKRRVDMREVLKRDLSARYIEQAAEASLKRLAIETIDLYLSH